MGDELFQNNKVVYLVKKISQQFLAESFINEIGLKKKFNDLHISYRKESSLS